MPSSLRVGTLRRYPVKGLRGYNLDHADLDYPGLRGDRRWMLIDENDDFITQREMPELALLPVEETETGLLFPHETNPHHTPYPPETAPETGGKMWNTPHPLRLTDDATTAWLSARLNRPVRLGYQYAPEARRFHTHGMEADTSVNLADDTPILLTTTASLDEFNTHLPAPVSMTRFRPNIVIEGATAWEEDQWRILRIGTCTLQIVRHCTRCGVITVDPETGTRPHKAEPLRTLARQRHHTGAPNFGRSAIILEPGRITVNDPVEILEREAT